MPQLDLMTFFPQFFWCFICFICFFLYFSYYIIPSIATILKFRKQKLIALANEINQKKDCSSNLLIEYDDIVRSSFQELKQLLDKLMKAGNTWVVFNVLKLNTTTLLTINQRFLKNSFKKDYVTLFETPPVSYSKARRSKEIRTMFRILHYRDTKSKGKRYKLKEKMKRLACRQYGIMYSELVEMMKK